MAQIDSGLGWSCDESFYIHDANDLVGWGYVNNSHYYKASAGGALAAKIRFDDGWNSAVIMSTVENYSKITITPSGSATTYAYIRNGITWYVTIPPYAVKSDGSPSDYPWIFYDDPLSGSVGFPSQIDDIAEAIISEANVQTISSMEDIPSVYYVHKYVEGIEAETVNRVNTLYNIIAPSFDSSTSYTVNDLVIYNHNLYKCTTAHPAGDWDNTHFTQTTIFAELRGGA